MSAVPGPPHLNGKWEQDGEKGAAGGGSERGRRQERERKRETWPATYECDLHVF